MAVYNDKILVACQGESLMAVIDPEEESVDRTIEVEGTPFSFFNFDARLFLYALGEDEILVYPINTADFSLGQTMVFRIPEAIYNGNFALGEEGEMYVIAGVGASSKVVKLSIKSGEILDENFFTGSNFYGLGFHNETNTLYIGEHNGWQGNGSVIRVNAMGNELERIPAGRGPSGFLFP
jgi:glutamine cyclotransferase